jgi:DNA topoisomerase-1
MIILRKGTKDKYWFEYTDGSKVTDTKTLDYLKTLRIPPAYHDVSIFYVKNPKIVFQGYDDAGRLQQIYSEEHCKAACRKKFQSLIDFGNKLPKIYEDCDKYMESDKPTVNKIIGVIIKIISLCYFRIGNSKYVHLYDHYGISTIHREHITEKPDGMHISFKGKKGIVNECYIKDKKINEALKSLIKNKKPKDLVFDFEEDGQMWPITPVEINKWLGTYGKDFTTKMFRNFDANIMFIEFMRNEHSKGDISLESLPQAKRKKIIVTAMKEISSEINNTPAICKKSYMSAELIKMYVENPKKFKTMFLLNKAPARNAFIEFLQQL